MDTSLVEDDPETRVGELLANVGKEIFQSAAEINWTRFEASCIYFEELCYQEETERKKIDNNLMTETSPLFRDKLNLCTYNQADPEESVILEQLAGDNDM